MYKRIVPFIFFLQCISSLCINAQNLEYLPPILTPNTGNNPSSETLIVGTVDYAKFSRKGELKPYLNSMQIIDPSNPWPPIWFTATDLYTQEMLDADAQNKRLRFFHLGYPQMLDNYLSYLYLAPVIYNKGAESRLKFNYSFVLLDSNMNAVDSIGTRLLYGAKNKSLEKLMELEVDTVWDYSTITSQTKDKDIPTKLWMIRVLDEKNNVIFEWNPIQKLNPEILQVKEILSRREQTNQNEVRLKKINNVCWDYDGNILYSSEFGMGKIARDDGRHIWQIDCSNDIYVEGEKELKFYMPTGLLLQKENENSCIYSFFDRGIDGLCSPHAVVFEQDKYDFSIKNVKYIIPQVQYATGIHGDFRYNANTGAYVIDYGVFENSDTLSGSYRVAMDYRGSNGQNIALLLPKWNYAFGINMLDHWPTPPRPRIKKEGALLRANGPMNAWAWYKVEGNDQTVVYKVGNESYIKPEKGAVYCLVGTYGIGYSVSLPYKN